jgi:hypothetical protein
MSLTSPRLIVPFITAVAALTIVSCGQQSTPTGPGSVTAPAALHSGSVVIIYDEMPAPDEPPPEDPSLGDPVPDPAPAPAPTPAPAPAPAPVPGSAPPSGTAPSPWPPGPPPPPAAPGTPVPTPPSTFYRAHITIDPEPVRHSGIPLGTAGCPDHSFTWYYDQRLYTDSGVGVTFERRENFFDGRYVSTNTSSIWVQGNSMVIVRTRWCSGVQLPHYAQTRYTATDEYGEHFTLSGPWVRLLSP